MIKLFFIAIILLLLYSECYAQAYNWNPETQISQGFYDVNPNFLYKPYHARVFEGNEFLIFERRNKCDTLSRISLIEMDINGSKGNVVYLSDGSFNDKNPFLCIESHWSLITTYVLSVWESKRGKNSWIVARIYNSHTGWSLPLIIDSTSDNHNPKACGLNWGKFAVVYQSANDILYKEIDIQSGSIDYIKNVTLDDSSYFSNPEVFALYESDVRVSFQKRKEDGKFSIEQANKTSSTVWSAIHSVSGQADNRTAPYYVDRKGAYPQFESDMNGRWNTFALVNGRYDTVLNINPLADNTSLRRFFNNEVVDGYLLSNAHAYLESIAGERRIMLDNFRYHQFDLIRDTVLLDSDDDGFFTLSSGIYYMSSYDFLVWVVYSRRDSNSNSLFGKSVRVYNTDIRYPSNLIPEKFFLHQNYPNPFNPNTTINYELRITSYVKLTVYDVNGKEVSTLVNRKQNAGSYKVEFDGSNLSSGIYFYKLDAGNFSETKRMILLK